MRKRWTLGIAMVFFSLLLVVQQVGLTQDDCPALVTQALQSVGERCEGLARNSACYGFQRVNATFSQEQPDDIFDEPGDSVGLTTLAGITTAPLDEQLEEWGVAVMSVQANLPDMLPGKAAVFLLLGDVTLENAIGADDAFQPADPPIDLNVLTNSNIRSRPSRQANVIGSAPEGGSLTTDAISADQQWLRVVFDGRTPGWIFRDLVQPASDITNLPVYSNESRTPMQAFYFKTGVGELTCNEAPSLLMVQGPEGAAVDITANGVNIRITSTIVLETVDGNLMKIMTVVGAAEVDGVSIPAGFQAEVPLDDEGKEQDGNIKPPKPMNEDELELLKSLEGIPSGLLNYPIITPDEPPPVIPTRPLVTPNPNVGTTNLTLTPTIAGACGGFRATSPVDGAFYGNNTFYWDPAPGATSYRLVIEGGPSGETTGTNYVIDLSGMGQNPQVNWYVEALVDGQVACRSQTVSIPREWAAAMSASVYCAGPNLYQIEYRNLPGGTDTLGITYDTTDTEITAPASPYLTGPAGDPGIVQIYSRQTVTLSNITLSAYPAGQSVSVVPSSISCP